MISPRTRELGFLLPGAVIGLLGVASVASARADAVEPGPLPVAAVAVGLFVLMHLALRLRAPQADPYVLPIVGVVAAIGLVTLHRIDPALARNQVLWLAVGAAVFIGVLVLMPDHHVLERYRYLIGLSAVLLLVITMLFGTEIYGARLWITLPGGQTVQPGELAKLLLVVFLAGYLRDKRELLAVPTRRMLGVPAPPLAVLGPMLALLGAALALVVVLNDFGTALLFFGVFLAMLYVATGRAAYAGVGLALFLAGAVAVWAVVPRIQDRVDAWLRPFDDPQGRGFQLVQSLYALADGGMFGPGWGKGFLVRDDGSFVVPVLDTDFIFTAVAAELGFIGALGLLCAFILLIARGLVIAAQANDGFSKLLAVGLTTVVGLQAFIIVGGVIRLIPLTGVTLPFMSYGGSSVVVNFALIALLLLVSHRTRRPWRPTARRRRAAVPEEAPEQAGAPA
ncbi:MAG TPA: FtsW/RodA/SpoVE family cell cycle protein [Miltoncostaeaceae bacterium]|nr:FtsW/RodA/SpoVE family cell cycle protein [Miltoncostaeaceae bacterium]